MLLVTITMPKRLRLTSAKRRKPFKRVKMGPRRLVIPRAIVPRQMKRKFTYCETIQIDSAASVVGQYLFYANGMYDPNKTGIGHQPMAFDQYVGVFYDHYTVEKATITCQFVSRGTTTSNTHLVGVRVQDTTTLITDLDEVVECDRTSSRILTGSNAKGTVTVRKTVRPPSFLRKPKYQDTMVGSAIGNPDEDVYFVVWARSTSDLGDAAAVDVIVRIDYIATLFEPKQLGLS